MIPLSNLTADAHQQTTVLLEDKTSVVVSLDFLPAVQQWNVSVEAAPFIARNITLAVHPNLLRSFRRTQNFGLACVAPDGVDPFDINDFQTGRVKLYVLDNTDGYTDVDTVEDTVFST
jgi:hypothetical protein